jgi:ferredoxin
MTLELTDSELKLVRANLAYAIENCPVDGGIVTEDGHLSTPEKYEGLQRKMKTLQVNPRNKVEVNTEELQFLIATAEYALDNCPVEGKIMMEDAQFSSKEMFQDLLKKLKAYDIKPMATTPISNRKMN